MLDPYLALSILLWVAMRARKYYVLFVLMEPGFSLDRDDSKEFWQKCLPIERVIGGLNGQTDVTCKNSSYTIPLQCSFIN